MGKKVKISEAALKKMIMESIMGEVGKGKIMPAKYKDIFTRRVQNAMHGHIGDVEKAVEEFYLQFKDKIPNEGFTLDYLMGLADKIEGGGTGGHGNPGAHRQSASDGWWATNQGKFLEESDDYKDAYSDNNGNMIQSRRDKDGKKHYRTVKNSDKTCGWNKPGKSSDGYKDAYSDNDGNVIQSRRDDNGKKHYRTVKVNESILRNIIKESVKRVIKESLMPDDPIVAKAQQLYDEGIDWEQEIDDVDGGWANGWVYADVVDENGDTWEFSADAGFNWEGDWVLEPDSIEEVRFTAPDGTEGTIPRP